jgi:hypothetical protein
MIKYLHLIIFSVGINNAIHAQKIINLSDYGVISNSYHNASANVARAIKDAAVADSCIIRFPGGRIDLWPEGAERREYFISNATEDDSLSKVKTIGMLFENKSNITLEGNNTLLVYHGKMMLMAIDHCDNFKVKDLMFDFQRPTMSEMKIVSKSDSLVVADINRDSWYAIEKQNNRHKLIWYGEGWKTNHEHVIRYVPKQETMYYESWKPFAESNVSETALLKVKFSGNFTGSKLNVGDILTIRDPYRDEVGVFNNRSHNVIFENLKFYYIHGLGIVSQFSENIFINRVSVAPRPGSGRVIAAFADCFHFSGCYGLVRIENCFTSGSHDDPVNIHGTALRIMKADSNKITVSFMHHQTWGFNAFDTNDSIEFVNHKTLLPFGAAVVKSSKMISKKEIELELDRVVPKEWMQGDCIENITKTPAAIIRNNRFEHTNTRGLLITTRRNVLIEGNTFFRTGMHAILIADDCNSWFESGPVKNVIIRNNKFIDCGYNSAPDDYVIFIKPETNNFEKARYVHSNISIRGNEFQIFDAPVLSARDVKGLIFSENQIIQKKMAGFPFDNKPMFNIEHCNGTEIQQNRFDGENFQKKILLRDMREVKYTPVNEFDLTMNNPSSNP